MPGASVCWAGMGGGAGAGWEGQGAGWGGSVGTELDRKLAPPSPPPIGPLPSSDGPGDKGVSESRMFTMDPIPNKIRSLSACIEKKNGICADLRP